MDESVSFSLSAFVRNHLVGVALPHPHATPHHHYVLYNERYIQSVLYIKIITICNLVVHTIL